MKEERRLIMQDAKGLFDARPADEEWIEQGGHGRRMTVQAWDEANLESWPQVRVPMRMVKAVYTEEMWIVMGGKKQRVTEVTERWMATTCDAKVVPARTLARIMAARWDIENQGFHDLKTYWHMDHAFVHDPVAIRAWLGILMVTVNLFYTFVYGHLHHFRERKIPLTEVVEEMKEEVRWMPESLAPLLWASG
ncbi:transposase [Ferroacidibacillus organovorans]|nr:transposase [Ferroacidibacillus organovorans]